MKYISYLSILIIFIGAAYSLYNAADDYGLRTISLPEFIKAQAETTNGDSTNGGDCDNFDILCDMEMTSFPFEDSYKANQYGELLLPSHFQRDCIPNEVYIVSGEYLDCSTYAPNKVCDLRKTGWFYNKISLKRGGGDSTNGDSTN